MSSKRDRMPRQLTHYFKKLLQAIRDKYKTRRVGSSGRAISIIEYNNE